MDLAYITNLPSKPIPSTIVGSSAYQSKQLSITSTAQAINLAFLAKSFMITNDGDDYITAWLNGNGVPTIYPYTSAQLVYTGDAWLISSSGAAGMNKNSWTLGDTVTLIPNKNVLSIGFTLGIGASAGTVSIELSNDGVTWVNPSSISGATLNGLSGTQIDTINCYNATVIAKSFLYTLPNLSAWSIRLTNTTANGSGAGVFVVSAISAGNFEDGLIIKANETITYPIASSNIVLQSNTGTQPIRLVVIA